MATIPPLRRLVTEDYADAPSWLGKLFVQLNSFLSSVYNAFSNGLTQGQNMIAQIRPEVKVSGAPPAAGTLVTKFPWTFQTKPVGCQIWQIRDVSPSPIAPTRITTAITLDWEYVAGYVNIIYIAGLDPTRTYSITFFISGG